MKLASVLQVHGFEVSETDALLFLLKRGGRSALLLIYVDDSVIVGTEEDTMEITSFLADLDITQLERSYFLGKKIVQDRQVLTILLTQRKHTRDISHQDSRESAKGDSSGGQRQDQPEGDDKTENPGVCAEVLCMLLYLTTCTRPELAYALGPSKVHGGTKTGALGKDQAGAPVSAQDGVLQADAEPWRIQA
jgi:hypothetical protein